MSELFLTKLALQEFRTFSECEVVLPNTPGVLLISGPNGLGKSTFFDALEWSLSGKVDRFERAKKGVTSDRYLGRWENRSNRPTLVEATFGNGKSTTRSIVETKEGQTGEDPTLFLRNPAWRTPIGDLHNYLLLTHFLGQSTLTRMTHRQPSERWEYLKGPARSDWATEVGAIFHGHGNSNEAKAYGQAAAAAQVRATRLADLLRTEETLFKSSRAAGALDETQIISEAIEALKDLKEIEADVNWPFGPLDFGQDAIERLAATVTTLNAWASKRAASIDRAASCLQRYSEATARLGQLQEEASLLVPAMQNLEARQQNAAFVARERQILLQSARSSAAGLEARLTALDTLRDRLEVLVARRRRLSEVDSEIANLDRDFAAADQQAQNLEKRLTISQSLERRLRSVLETIQDDEAMLQSVGELAELDTQIGVLETEIAEFDRSNPNLETRIAVALDEQGAIEERLNAAENTLAAARDAFDRLSAAVVGVAAHIEDSTCVCPVCASEFAPGELRARALTATAAFGTTLVPLETAVRQSRTSAQGSAQAAEALVSLGAKAQRQRQILASLHDDRRAKTKQLDGLRGYGSSAEARLGLQNSLANLHKKAQRNRRWVSVLGSIETVRSDWQNALIARNELEARLSDRRAHRASEFQAIARGDGNIVLEVISLDLTQPLSSEHVADVLELTRRERADAQAMVGECEAELEKATTLVTAIQRELGVAVDRQGEITSAQSIAGQIITETKRDWILLEMPGDAPSENARRQAELTLQTYRKRIDAADQTELRLRTGHSMALQQRAHLDGLRQLALAIGATHLSGRDEIRSLASDSQQQALSQAKRFDRAEVIAQLASQQINERVGTFNRQYLKPLNELMHKINRAILTDPDVGLDLEFERNAVRQKTRPLSRAPGATGSLDPLLVHSEGQMAALAASMLCAASLTFTWSSWRALIMDDPLQHNDVVHASAFADLMRNLVLDRRYQIFLSTHDMGQADFLRRKFLAGGVPCTVVQLVGRGQNGTLVEVQQPYTNAA